MQITTCLQTKYAMDNWLTVLPSGVIELNTIDKSRIPLISRYDIRCLLNRTFHRQALIRFYRSRSATHSFYETCEISDVATVRPEDRFVRDYYKHLWRIAAARMCCIINMEVPNSAAGWRVSELRALAMSVTRHGLEVTDNAGSHARAVPRITPPDPPPPPFRRCCHLYS